MSKVYADWSRFSSKSYAKTPFAVKIINSVAIEFVKCDCRVVVGISGMLDYQILECIYFKVAIRNPNSSGVAFLLSGEKELISDDCKAVRIGRVWPVVGFPWVYIPQDR